MSVFKDCFTELEDSCEIGVHLIFELDDLLMSQLIFGVVKYLF